MVKDKEALQNILVECYKDYSKLAKILFPERFFRSFDPVHYNIFNKLKSENRHVAVAAPRGIGKTTINNLLLPARSILFQEAYFIMVVSSSLSHAQTQSESLKHELISNPVIRKLFGDVTTTQFNKDQWVARVGNKEICVMPRGAGQQVRGFLFRGRRPDLIIVDDLEDTEHMDSEEQRRKKKEWFFADLLNVVDRPADNWKVVVLGTVLHHDSLLIDLLESPDWDSIRLELCDEDFRSNAPNFLDDESCRELYDMYERNGEIEVFIREYRNLVVSSKHNPFQKEMFKPYEPDDVKLDKSPFVENVVIVDTARTTGEKSAETAMVAEALDFKNGTIYIRDIVHGKLHFNDIIDQTINMALRNNARIIGLEVTGLHEFITYPFRNEISKRGLNIEIIELHARGGVNEKGKAERVASLAPFYRKGCVYHNKAVSAGLEQQLLSFPRPKRWDIMDAASYGVELFEKGEQYMQAALDAQMDDESMEAIEKEYEELDELFAEHEDMEDFRLI